MALATCSIEQDLPQGADLHNGNVHEDSHAQEHLNEDTANAELKMEIRYYIFPCAVNASCGVDDERCTKTCCLFEGLGVVRFMMEMLKLALVITQLVLFGQSRAQHVAFFKTNQITFENLYLKGWSAERETVPYPPNSGKLAVYTQQDFYDNLDFVVKRFCETATNAVGVYYFNGTQHDGPSLCSSYSNTTEAIYQDCVTLEVQRMCSISTDKRNYTVCTCDSYTFLRDKAHHGSRLIMDRAAPPGHLMNFDNLTIAKVNFTLSAVQLKPDSQDPKDCWNFLIEILFDNSGRNGQLAITMETTPYIQTMCGGQQDNPNLEERIRDLSLGVLVILVCLASLVWRTVMIFRMCQLKRKAEKCMPVKMTDDDKSLFFNWWYGMIVLCDLLLIIGTVLKICIDERKMWNYEACSLFLGIGNLLIWVCCLRYFQFHTKFNVLLQTMKRAGPDVIYYLCCTIVLYLGFAFCGWIMMGPYHNKFRSFETTVACLFALINGDEIYVTLANIEKSNWYLYLFAYVYIIAFVCLFVYVVISVFIAIIERAYEVIRERYDKKHKPQSSPKDKKPEPESSPTDKYPEPEPEPEPSPLRKFVGLGNNKENQLFEDIKRELFTCCKPEEGVTYGRWNRGYRKMEQPVV